MAPQSDTPQLGQDKRAKESDDMVQFLVFRLGTEEYVLDIMRVNEIIRPRTITSVRRAPDYVRGVIELRGTIVPILDLRSRLSLAHAPATQPHVVIVTVEGVVVGLEVDSVAEVVRVDRASIKPSPELTQEIDGRAPFFLGICSVGDRLLQLLNIKRLVMTRDEVTPHAWAREGALEPRAKAERHAKDKGSAP